MTSEVSPTMEQYQRQTAMNIMTQIQNLVVVCIATQEFFPEDCKAFMREKSSQLYGLFRAAKTAEEPEISVAEEVADGRT